MDKQAPSAGRPSGPNGAWNRYRKQFITPDNVQNGVNFWNQHQEALQRAYEVYGVPPEIIVGIIGVETRWGRVMGKTRIIDALATLSFAYPRRAEYFSGELETFLLMARAEGNDPLSLRGLMLERWGTANLCHRHSKAMLLILMVTATSIYGTRRMPSAVSLTTSNPMAGPKVRWSRCPLMGKRHTLIMALRRNTLPRRYLPQG